MGRVTSRFMRTDVGCIRCRKKRLRWHFSISIQPLDHFMRSRRFPPCRPALRERASLQRFCFRLMGGFFTQLIDSTTRSRSSLLAAKAGSRTAVKRQPGETTHGTYNSIPAERFCIRAINAVTASLRFEWTARQGSWRSPANILRSVVRLASFFSVVRSPSARRPEPGCVVPPGLALISPPQHISEKVETLLRWVDGSRSHKYA
jgi:hypothetical protein